MYDCHIVKRVAGSSTTYEWYDVDYGIKRQTVVVSHRPIKVKSSRNGERNYVRTRQYRIDVDDMTRISAVRLGKRTYDYGVSDSMFSGYMMDSDAYVDADGEFMYLARFWC
jgi:hypothetical protein